MTTPTYKEDHSSQLPAMLLLANLGWQYLPPEQAERRRLGNQANPILEPILKQWLSRNNRIEFHGATYDFTDGNIEQAVEQMRGIDFVDGVRAANQRAYDLLT